MSAISRCLVSAMLCLCASAMAAETGVDPASYEARIVSEFPSFQPGPPVSGVIRVWGHGHVKLRWLDHLLGYWQEGFRRYQPGVTIEGDMHGTSSAIPALALGEADIALLGEEIDPLAVIAFEKVKHYTPIYVDVMTGSVDVRNFDYAQQVFVHRDNPISRLTLAQLDGILGEEHRRGPANIRGWSQLGLKGDWAGKPIQPYGWAINDSFGIYLGDAVLEGSHRWNCDIKEFVHINRPDGTIYDHGQQILDALGADRYGIAVSNQRYIAANPVKAVALAEHEGGPYYHATKETLIQRQYPLTRLLPIIIDRQPGMPIDPKVKEFLRYILSREGQEAVNQDGRYLPISKETAALELKKLE